MQKVLIFNLVTNKDIEDAAWSINNHLNEDWEITSSTLSGGILFVILEKQSQFICEGDMD